ncbi:outer membrane beta-barrel protein [uncultured Bacteroides sp.]|jgi:tonB-dependent receptor|uniref:outer membrane beta-barrel protein n=1 Tax=uncultured Bacteroides sp. TaxID=162156 RepID=UPI00280B347D|nr:outer membrane beta-barrel protein [uncultured Bacteroides sp.]
MKQIKIISGLLLSICTSVSLWSQTTGKIIDTKQQPVEGATIVMQQPDSTYLGAAISAPDGTFVLEQESDNYLLIIQHLLYHVKQVKGQTADAGIITLEQKDYNLDEVVIKGERPLVKVENGRLGYDLSVLSEKQVVNNAYEAITKLPGVQENNGTLSLAGASSLTIMMNGKPTTMTPEQLETLLRNTPVNRVEKAEVMYSAPPELHVREAVINVVTKRSHDYSFQGELSTNYQNRYFSSGGVNGNFRLSTPKVTLDIMYGADNIRTMEYTDLFSRHALNNNVYEITQNEKLNSKSWMHNVRTALEYNINEKNRLDVAYTGNFTPNGHSRSIADGSFQQSDLDKFTDNKMNNITVRYSSGIGLEVGGDYTRYTSDNNQAMFTQLSDKSENSYTLIGGQRIDRYSVYADQKHNLANNWGIGYGVSYRYAKDYDFQTYNNVTGNIKPENTVARLNEQTTNFYFSLSKNWATGTSLSVSATGEYYTIGNYHKWAVYPQASLTYLKSPQHTFQLSLSTDKTYPGYWDMQSSVTYLNGYSELQGTPGLRPMTNYNLNGTYILKQKYIFGLFYMHTSDYFAQTPYQAIDRLALIYKNTNWNYMRMVGANVILPFSIGNWYDVRLTLVGMQARQKCNQFFDVPFDRKKWLFAGTLDNTFKVGKNLSFELTGNIQTPFIQGTLDLASSFNLTAGMKWNFAKDRCSLTVRCSDIFNSSMPDMKVRFKGQYLDMNPGFYTRTVSLNFTYRFGGYKKQKIKGVDTSRFGH